MKTGKALNCFWIIISLVMLFGAGEAMSATYYVSPTGNDSNSGLIGAPFRTIQKAANVVNPGDTVIVKNGTYTDTTGKGTIITMTRGGTSSGRITFKAENMWGAVIDGQKNTGLCIQIKALAQYITIEDFEIKGCDSNGIQSPSFGTVNNIIIKGNNIHSMGRKCDSLSNGNSGIFMGHGISHVIIDSNVIHDNGRYWAGTNGCTEDNGHDNDHGIYSHASNVVVKNNIFYNQNSGVDVNIKALVAPGAGNNVNVTNNVFGPTATTKNGRVYLTGKDSDGYRNENVTIQNNSFYTGNSSYAIDVWPSKPAGSGQRNITIRNNSIPTEKLIRPIDSAYQNQFAFSQNISGQDPKFVKPSSYDYRLQSGSPNIDKGVHTTDRVYDADGNSISGMPDMGAFEYAGNTDTTAPSVPAELTATAVSSSQIDLSWKPSTDNVGVAGYKVYRDGALTGTVATTKYSDTGLAASTSYGYTVAAYDSAGNTSSRSVPVSETTKASSSTTTTTNTTIIDNGSSGTSYTGIWSDSDASGYYGSGSVWSRDGSTYTWTFTPKVSGKYKLFMWWTAWPSRSASVPIDIAYSGGTRQINVNQRKNGGKWNGLYAYYFEAGKSYKITITSQAGPSSTSADAVKFEYVSSK